MDEGDKGLAFQARVKSERVQDAIVQLRCDSRTLATIAAFMFKQGVLPQSPPQLVRLALEAYKDALVSSGMVEDVLSVTDAVQYLQHLGLGGINPSGRGKRERLKQLQREAMVLEGLDPNQLLQTGKGKLLERAKHEEIRHAAEEVMERMQFSSSHSDDQLVKKALANVPLDFVVDNEDDNDR